MDVKLHWQIETEDEWRQDEAPEPRRLPLRLGGVLLLLTVSGLGIAVGRLWYRARQGQARLRREFEAVVNLEVQALCQGDDELFLSLQDQRDARWYGRQMDRIRPGLGVTGSEPGHGAALAVLDAALLPLDDRAWAEVAWTEEDGIYRRAQFYRRLEGRWLRTGARSEYFGSMRARQTGHFSFSYHLCDEPTVEWMAGQLEDWYGAACADLGCGDTSPINVLIAPNGEAGESFFPPQGLVFRSARLRGVRDDGAPLPSERRELAEALLHLLVVRTAGESMKWNQPYLLPQFVNWELRRLGLADAQTPPVPLLDRVMESHGPEGMRALLIAAGETTWEAQALDRALGVDLESLGVEMRRYLAALLALERQVMDWQTTESLVQFYKPLAEPIFRQLFAPTSSNWPQETSWRTNRWWDDKNSAFRDWREHPREYTPVTPLLAPRVQAVEVHDDWAWAQVSYAEPGYPPTFEPLSPQRLEVFYRINGTWRHGPPDERFLGREVVLTGEHFRLEGHEWAGPMMARQLSRLEALNEVISQDMGISLPEGERLTVRWVTSGRADHVAHIFGLEIVYPAFNDATIDQDRFLDKVAVPFILGQWAMRQTGNSQFASTDGLFWFTALSDWYRDHLLGRPDLGWRQGLRPAVETDTLIPLSRLALMDYVMQRFFGYGVATYWTGSRVEAVPLNVVEMVEWQARSVIVYMMEIHGLDALPAMVVSMSGAASFEVGLWHWLNVDLATFEAGWKSWLSAQVTR
jgi:hypothetical protein